MDQCVVLISMCEDLSFGLRALVKTDMAVLNCNLSAPVATWEWVTAESLQAS